MLPAQKQIIEAILADAVAGLLGALPDAPALNPVIGYERSTELAAEAMRTGRGILELVREQKVLTEEQIAQVLDPVVMTGGKRPV